MKLLETGLLNVAVNEVFNGSYRDWSLSKTVSAATASSQSWAEEGTIAVLLHPAHEQPGFEPFDGFQVERRWTG